MATPRAQEYYEKLFATFKAPRINNRYQPIHHRLATHWARLIEMLSAAERMLELAQDPEITDPHVRTQPMALPIEGVGCVEAPRGTLIHHYWTDERGLLTGVNLVVGTTNNYAAIALSVKKAAMQLISRGTVVTEGLLNRIEMAFRLYDPCFSCATHALPGEMPLEVVIRDGDGRELTRIGRH
jgi:F420-non-reducing hydrogenase large subunit